jgi:hypothetical protein
VLSHANARNSHTSPRKAADLRTKLDQAAEGAAWNGALDQVAALSTQRDEVKAAAVQAREQAASLDGQVDALREQNTQLLQTFKPTTGKTTVQRVAQRHQPGRSFATGQVEDR